MFSKLFNSHAGPIEELKRIATENVADHAALKGIARRGVDAEQDLAKARVALAEDGSVENAETFVAASHAVSLAPHWQAAFVAAKPSVTRKKVVRSLEPCRVAVEWLIAEMADKIAKVREADLQLRADLNLGPVPPPAPQSDRSSAPPPQPQQSAALTALLHRGEKCARLRRRLFEDWNENDIPACAATIDEVLKVVLSE